jgi:hypothetical protein
MEHIKRNRDKTFNNLVVAESLTLTNGAKDYLTLRPFIEIGKIAQNSKPTVVARGVSKGYSLPVYAADDEEIFMCTCAPRRWDGESDPIFVLPVYIDTANENKKFKLQVSWEHYDSDTDIVPDTSNDVEIEVDLVGIVAQFQSFKLNFIFDYDIDGDSNLLEAYQRVCARVRRIAASANEMTGEVVIGPPVVKFLRDKA